MKNTNANKDFIKDYNNSVLTYDVKLNVKEAQKNIALLKQEIESLNSKLLPININFYGCSFNLVKDSSTDSKYINNSDIYNSKGDDNYEQ